jgi:hypothetical protein
MIHAIKVILLFLLVLLLPLERSSAAPYSEWKHSGSVFVVTTPEGANLAAGTSVADFPLLVRLHRESFDFSQALPDGDDLRFATSSGVPLPYQIEEWDAEHAEATVWVRVPKIEGNARQELRLFWGNTQAKSESSGSSVFDASNGYVSVWHLGKSVADATGTLETEDVRTTVVPGMVGDARHLSGGQGIYSGDDITVLPAGSASHTTQAWFRAEKPNATIIGWGNEQAQGKVVMQFRSPPHVRMDCYFSDGNVGSERQLAIGDWIHVAHTYKKGDSRLYVNGVLDGSSQSRASTLNIRSPARLWLGGWYNNYTFVGDLDEVRVSNVVRPPDWLRLEYENQKPLQTLVGHIVRHGDSFGVSHSQLTVVENGEARLTATADGAQKVYWILNRRGHKRVVAVDQFSYTFDAGRVTDDETATLQFRAIYADEVRTRDLAITVTEQVAEPQFTLKMPSTWDGRQSVEITPAVSNLAQLKSAGSAELDYQWRVSGAAVIKETTAGSLVLKRAMGSGSVQVTLELSNGGVATSQSAMTLVTEPEHDVWVERIPAENERPVDGQFYARDESGFGTLFFNGTLDKPAATVLLRVYSGEKLYEELTQKPEADRRYKFVVRLKPGLVNYRTEAVARDAAGKEQPLHKADDILCGDAFLITGQSNAVATDWGKAPEPQVNEWVRTFGATSGGANDSRLKMWAPAVARGRGGKSQIGYWGMELGRRIVESQRVPVCILNGAVGGTRVDQHQRDTSDPTDAGTIYGRLLWRVREAGLTHGIRGVFWHQGENDQGADGPTGGYGWETYREYFHELAGAWKTDFPNLQHIHLFQIWPRACAMGVNGSDNMLREVQRTLPRDFSRMSIMSTLGIQPPGGCHYPAAGYAEFARLLIPLVERDFYGVTPKQSITPPDLLNARYSSNARDAITLEFDQPVMWSDDLAGQFYLDGVGNAVKAGRINANTLTLDLSRPSNAKRLTYLNSRSWNPERILVGANGIAALTFYEVTIK